VYNSLVNNQLAHKTIQLTLVKLGNKIAPKAEKLLKGEKSKKYVTRKTGNLLRDSLRRNTTRYRQQ